MVGQVVKGIGGFYFLEQEGQLIRCRGRGLLKRDGQKILIGDRVRWEEISGSDGIIEAVLPRDNSFIRPPIANVEQMIIVMALTSPKPNLEVIDRFLLEGEKNGVSLGICINKIDLNQPKTWEEIREIYGNLYPLYPVSGEKKEGLARLKEALKGKVSAFAGPSGVGKSTLINSLYSGISLETGRVSEKTKRGRHTTRYVELISPEPGTKIFDTPGFTAFHSSLMEEQPLDRYFPEMKPYWGHCQYHNCQHLREPGCAVRKGLDAGKIHPRRYATYQKMQLEMEKERENLY